MISTNDQKIIRSIIRQELSALFDVIDSSGWKQQRIEILPDTDFQRNKTIALKVREERLAKKGRSV